jgi:hypothetical protein
MAIISLGAWFVKPLVVVEQGFYKVAEGGTPEWEWCSRRGDM